MTFAKKTVFVIIARRILIADIQHRKIVRFVLNVEDLTAYLIEYLIGQEKQEKYSTLKGDK